VTAPMSYMGFDLAQLKLMPILGKVLEAIGQQMSGTNNVYNNNTQLASFLGATANGQQGVSALASTGFQQLTNFMGQSQAVTTAGSMQLMATQAQMKSIAATATAQGYQVWPAGVVTPGERQIAICAAHWSTWGPARLKMYWARANAYTASINGQLGQAATLDQQIASALIKMVTDTLGNFLQKKINGDSTSGSLPNTTVPGSTIPTTGIGTRPVTLPAFTGTDPSGFTPLSGGLAGVSPGALGGVGALGGASGVPGAVSLAGAAGAAGALGVGATPAAGAVAGARAGMGGMMPMGAGAGAGARGGEQRTASTWLNEDEDPWKTDNDAPDGVVA
jgi:hypothetical protein